MAWLTYADLVRFGLEYLGSYDRATPESLRFVKLSIETSLREILAEHDWSYLQSDASIVTKAPYYTGTITFDAPSRQMTLTGGTWPSWAASGTVLIGDRWYDVESRTSDTVIVMKDGPPESIATDTAYGIYQDTYDLPVDFSVLQNIFRMDTWQSIQRQSPQQLFEARQVWRSAGTPNYFAIYGSPNTPGRMALRFSPVPDSEEEFPYLYKRVPKTPTNYREVTGTVTIANGSSSVTGTGTAFSSRHVGAILRVGMDGKLFPGSTSEEYPNVFEAKIVSVAGLTSLTVDAAPSEDLTSRSLCISDPIDIDQTIMTSLIHRAICRRLAIDRKMDMNQRQLVDTDYGNELLRAKGADSRIKQPRNVGFQPMRFRRLRIGPDAFSG